MPAPTGTRSNATPGIGRNARPGTFVSAKDRTGKGSLRRDTGAAADPSTARARLLALQTYALSRQAKYLRKRQASKLWIKQITDFNCSKGCIPTALTDGKSIFDCGQSAELFKKKARKKSRWMCNLDDTIKYREAQHRVHEHEFRVFIEGAEVTHYIQGALSWTIESTGGMNTARFVLNNNHDAFIITPQNICAGPYSSSGWRIPGNRVKRGGYYRPAANYDAHDANADESAKFNIYRHKYNVVNPESKQWAQIDTTTAMWLYPLNPFSCIFDKHDAVRIFIKLPHVGRKHWKNVAYDYDLWMPVFAGFIKDYSWNDDPIGGARVVNITCYDYRGLLDKMRVRVFAAGTKVEPAGGKNKGRKSTAQTSEVPPEASTKSAVDDAYLKPARDAGNKFGAKFRLLYKEYKEDLKKAGDEGAKEASSGLDPFVYAVKKLFMDVLLDDIYILEFQASMLKGGAYGKEGKPGVVKALQQGSQATEGRLYNGKKATTIARDVRDKMKKIALEWVQIMSEIVNGLAILYYFSGILYGVKAKQTLTVFSGKKTVLDIDYDDLLPKVTPKEHAKVIKDRAIVKSIETVSKVLDGDVGKKVHNTVAKIFTWLGAIASWKETSMGVWIVKANNYHKVQTVNLLFAWVHYLHIITDSLFGQSVKAYTDAERKTLFPSLLLKSSHTASLAVLTSVEKETNKEAEKQKSALKQLSEEHVRKVFNANPLMSSSNRKFYDRVDASSAAERKRQREAIDRYNQEISIVQTQYKAWDAQFKAETDPNKKKKISDKLLTLEKRIALLNGKIAAARQASKKIKFAKSNYFYKNILRVSGNFNSADAFGKFPDAAVKYVADYFKSVQAGVSGGVSTIDYWTARTQVPFTAAGEYTVTDPVFRADEAKTALEMFELKDNLPRGQGATAGSKAPLNTNYEAAVEALWHKKLEASLRYAKNVESKFNNVVYLKMAELQSLIASLLARRLELIRSLPNTLTQGGPVKTTKELLQVLLSQHQAATPRGGSGSSASAGKRTTDQARTRGEVLTRYADFTLGQSGIFGDLVTATRLDPHPLAGKSFEEAINYLCSTNTKTSKGIIHKLASYGSAEDAKKMQQWNNVVMFGMLQRPFTYSEVTRAGYGTTGDYFSVLSPMHTFYHLMIPETGTAASTIVQQNTGEVGVNSLTLNYQTRKKLLDDICSTIDYQFFISGWGDLIFEPPHYNAHPAAFGKIYSGAYTVSQEWRSASITEESIDLPTAWVFTGMDVDKKYNKATGGTVPTNLFRKIVVMNLTLARRIGVRVENVMLKIPGVGSPIGIGARGGDKDIAYHQLKAYGYFHIQRQLGRAHTFTLSLPFRPYIVPNRPIYFVPRQRIGLPLSITNTLSAPNGEGETSISMSYTRWRFRDGSWRFIGGGRSQPINYTSFFLGFIPKKGSFAAQQLEGNKGKATSLRYPLPIEGTQPNADRKLACRSTKLRGAARAQEPFSANAAAAFDMELESQREPALPFSPEISEVVDGPASGFWDTEVQTKDRKKAQPKKPINIGKALDYMKNPWMTWKLKGVAGASDSFFVRNLGSGFYDPRIRKKDGKSTGWGRYHGGWDLNAGIGDKCLAPIPIFYAEAMMYVGRIDGNTAVTAFIEAKSLRKQTKSINLASGEYLFGVRAGKHTIKVEYQGNIYYKIYADQFLRWKALTKDGKLKLKLKRRDTTGGGLVLRCWGYVQLPKQASTGNILCELGYYHLDSLETYNGEIIGIEWKGSKSGGQTGQPKQIPKGQAVAIAGKSGATGSHLHFEMKLSPSGQGNKVDQQATQVALAATKQLIDQILQLRVEARPFTGRGPNRSLNWNHAANSYWNNRFGVRQPTNQQVLDYLKKQQEYQKYFNNINNSNNAWIPTHPALFFTPDQIIQDSKSYPKNIFKKYRREIDKHKISGSNTKVKTLCALKRDNTLKLLRDRQKECKLKPKEVAKIINNFLSGIQGQRRFRGELKRTRTMSDSILKTSSVLAQKSLCNQTLTKLINIEKRALNSSSARYQMARELRNRAIGATQADLTADQLARLAQQKGSGGLVYSGDLL